MTSDDYLLLTVHGCLAIALGVMAAMLAMSLGAPPVGRAALVFVVASGFFLWFRKLAHT